MVMAPRTSMSGDDTACARTQRRLTRSSRRVAVLNFSISNGSMAKALTMRMPEKVSCRTLFSSPILSWLLRLEARM